MAHLRLALLAIGVAMCASACRPSGQPAGPSAAGVPQVQPAGQSRAPTSAAVDDGTSPQVPSTWQSRLPSITPAQASATRKQADSALARGQLEQGNGPGPGALELYLAVLAVVPDDQAAAAGVRATLETLLERGRLAMRSGALPIAARINAIVTAVLPAHPDLVVYRARLDAARRAQAEIAKANRAGKRGRLLDEKDSVASHLALAQAADSEYLPVAATRQRWNASVLKNAWAHAEREDFTAADAALMESAKLAPGDDAARVMGLRVIELRQARTNAVIAEGNAAVDALKLDRADTVLDHAARIAAQPARVNALRERIHLARHYGPFLPRQVFSERMKIGGVAPEMVVVPYGVFDMGSQEEDVQAQASELPSHEVTFVRGYAIGRSEVTVGEFGRFIADSGYRTYATRLGHSTVFDERGGVFSEHSGVDWRRDHVGRIASQALPVVHLAFEDAQAYTSWLSGQTGEAYRLPSEAEFEYALRAGTKSTYPWGDQPPARVVGNLPGDGDLSRSGRRWGNAIHGYRDAFWGPAPVRNFDQERFGTYDMVGNVSEWTLDCWHESYQRAPADGSAWVNPGCPQRVIRGASWASSLDRARSAARLAADPITTTAQLGFRVVREL